MGGGGGELSSHDDDLPRHSQGRGRGQLQPEDGRGRGGLWWWRLQKPAAPASKRQNSHGLLGQPFQRIRIRPRARPHRWPAGLATKEDSPEAAAPGRAPRHGGDPQTGGIVIRGH